MLVGLTYDLRDDYLKEGFTEDETAEFDRVDTIIAIESTLQSLGYETDRIGNVKDLVKRLSMGERWDIVFNICEGLYGIGRESQVPALLDAYKIPYTFSDPMVLALTLHKGMTKHVVRDLGLATPDFYVVNLESDIDRIDLPYPLFAKPLAEGTGKGINADSKINNINELRNICKGLLTKYKQPVLVETFLSGREFTVAIVGTENSARSLGVMEVVLKSGAEADVYSYVNKENCEELVVYSMADGGIRQKCEELALNSWRGLGCRDAGRVDIRMDKNGVPHFIEVNPLAGIHPEHSDLPIICNKTGIPYKDLIYWIMESAKKRM